MARSKMTQNFQSGLFENEKGQQFVRCEFIPDEPIWIDVNKDCWSAVYAGARHKLDWANLRLPPAIVVPLKIIVRERLRTRAPSHLAHLHSGLADFKEATSGVDLKRGFEPLSTSIWLKIWTKMNPHSRSTLRELYSDLALRQLGGSRYSISREMQSWKARENVVHLRRVLEWDAEHGSLSAAEAQLVADAFKCLPEEESDQNCAVRTFGWLLFETLKRPTQILSMRRNALWIVEGPEGAPHEYFVRIPKAKSQAAEKPEMWQITEKLGRQIQSLSHRTTIRALQERHDRLVILPGKRANSLSWTECGQVDVCRAYQHLRQWAKELRLLSPRTKRGLHLTALRIRHTGATGMAMQGAPRDEIQTILEHDSPLSAQAYIDSVGADLIPVFERADRGLGDVFSGLSNAFFKGVVVAKLGKRPINIPVIAERPAVVGSCGKEGACTMHPFWACYDGCPHFLAWREADHRKSLAYVTAEFERWNMAEGGKERTKLVKDFDRIGAAIKEVVKQIEDSTMKGRQK
jgi:hypothetical protein